MNGQIIRLQTPLGESDVRRLRRGDIVELTGSVFTGRDAVHKYLFEGGASPVDLEGAVIYHCGPVVVKEKGEWVVKAAGPTTSIREEPYMAELIRRLRIRGVIGKGGMGPKTLEACQEIGCVYLHAIGGAAQVLARRIVKVAGVHLLEMFGSPEAIWHLMVDSFPAVVTMDAHGASLHEEVARHSREQLDRLLTTGR